MLETKKILLLVSGNSPQIITETLYALITQSIPWVPNEIHLITTQQGRSNAIGQLLNEKTPVFKQLLRDYGISQSILFDHSTIHIIEHNGNQLDDLRTPEENQAAADCISENIRQLTQSENTELHVSLAGGRKTMGFYAGYALSLFGRVQDKLSHVLVSENYESSDFYYPAPTPDSHWIKTREGKSLDSHKAKIWLAEIPFVRMRSSLPESSLLGGKSFSETIDLARLANENPVLNIIPKQKKIILNGKSLNLSPVHMALLLWVVQSKTPIRALVDGERDRTYKEDFLKISDEYWLEITPRTADSIASGITKEFMQTNISRLNKELKKGFGEALANRCRLASRKTKDGRGYSLPDDIHVEIQ